MRTYIHHYLQFERQEPHINFHCDGILYKVSLLCHVGLMATNVAPSHTICGWKGGTHIVHVPLLDHANTQIRVVDYDVTLEHQKLCQKLGVLKITALADIKIHYLHCFRKSCIDSDMQTRSMLYCSV